jgi:hypothetical protein
MSSLDNAATRAARTLSTIRCGCFPAAMSAVMAAKTFPGQLNRPRGEMCRLRGLRRPAKRTVAGYPLGQVPDRGQERW